jgi:hypothetical protein
MVKLRSVGKAILIAGLAIVFLGVFIAGASFASPHAGLGALIGLVMGIAVIVYFGLPITVVGLVIYLIGRWREREKS